MGEVGGVEHRMWRGGAGNQGAGALPADMALLLADGFDPRPILAATAAAHRSGVSPLDALRCRGAVSEEALVSAFAQRLGTGCALRVSELGAFGRAAIEDPHAVLERGLLRVDGADGQSRLLVAARGEAVARLAVALGDGVGRAAAVTLTPPRLFAEFVRGLCADRIARAAAAGPKRLHPALSAENIRLPLGPFVLAMLAVLALLLAAPMSAAALLELALSLTFLAAAGLRLMALLTPSTPRPPPKRLTDRALPVYTVLVPLYRESRVAGGIVAALRRLDYPPEKLDIKLLLEADDTETRAALAAVRLPPWFEVVVVPPGEPRTKPRALNAGLIGARGSLLAVFDAEDRPEPGQLRIAAEHFHRAGPDLACLQGALAIDNLRPRPLARLFAVEYAALFDALLPALAARRLPMLLGGSSNHFRTEIVRRVGAWDAANVTEDADLGMRLARLGFATGVVPTSTYEEAPARLWPWLKQRTRWMKGHLVSWAVHAGAPRRLVRELGPGRALVAQLLLAGTPLAALAHLGFLVIVPAQIAAGAFLSRSDALGIIAHGATVVSLAVGYAVALGLAARGLAGRRRLDLLPWLALLPLYWVLVAIATIRAVSQLGAGTWADWEKTEHGLEDRVPGGAVRSSPSGPWRPVRAAASG